jgi:hypothetical protein
MHSRKMDAGSGAAVIVVLDTGVICGALEETKSRSPKFNRTVPTVPGG